MTNLKNVRFTKTLEATREGTPKKVHFHEDTVHGKTDYRIEFEIDGFQKKMKFATENDGFGSTTTEAEFHEIWDGLKRKGMEFTY